jgi:hypothetical protein
MTMNVREVLKQIAAVAEDDPETAIKQCGPLLKSLADASMGLFEAFEPQLESLVRKLARLHGAVFQELTLAGMTGDQAIHVMTSLIPHAIANAKKWDEPTGEDRPAGAAPTVFGWSPRECGAMRAILPGARNCLESGD